jgi:hypothetical protein
MIDDVILFSIFCFNYYLDNNRIEHKKTRCYYQHLLISLRKDGVCGCWWWWWWTINIIGRLCMCMCVSSSYRLFVNSSCTHTHTYTKQNWFFFSPSLSFVFLFFLFTSLLVLNVCYRCWEYFFPIVPPCLSSSIFELSHWKFSIRLAFHSDVTRSFAWLHTMPFSFLLFFFYSPNCGNKRTNRESKEEENLLQLSV